MDLLEQFKNPPGGYGEVAFFWWHGDKITKEKLLWILNQLRTHAISGLQINYAHSNTGGEIYGLTLKSDPHPLSEEWWELVGWFINECKKYDIAVSLSDYTLGSPGQGFYMDEVIKKHPEMIGQRLEYIDGEVRIVKVKNTVNPMHKNLGAAVIKEFYGRFDEHFPNECGKGINFFFSDELNFNIRGNLWSDDFAQEFLNRKGYDILPKLNAIFIDIGDETPKIRLDYYDVIVQLSEEGYFKPVYDWHQERGMIFGCDHGGRGRDVTEFGDYFRTMKWNQGPGNDQPKLESDVIKSKVSSSIAHLYKRPRTWLEGFYSSGWGTSSADVTQATFKNFAMGHNLLSLHGLYYSTHGSMWEWAPPCNHYHMPYWEGMKTFLKCTERLSFLLSQGVHRCDVAIIYPVAAMEADVNMGEQSVSTAFAAANTLYPNGIDFDFIDFESIVNAKIEDKMLKIAGEEYKILIIPSMNAVRFDMIKKIEAFAKEGGIIINVGRLPTESDRAGSHDDELTKVVSNIQLVAHMVDKVEVIPNIIRSRIILDFDTQSKNPYVLHRIIKGKDLYMVYNIPQNERIFFRAKGVPSLLDPWSGTLSTQSICYQVSDEGTYISMPLTESEVMLIMFDTTAVHAQVCDKQKEAITIDVKGEWDCEVKPTMDNEYGDYRLPAFKGYIGAEVRQFKCEQTNDDCSGIDYDDSDWKESTYSYGTKFWLYQGDVSWERQQSLINMVVPTSEFMPYDFSMQLGVEGDAGHQASYHGLKGKISDDFIALGKMRLTYASSSSVYEGDGTYYLFTTVYSPCEQVGYISMGDLKPANIWINHAEYAPEQATVTLNKGTNYILLRYNQSGRTHFIVLTSDDFIQTYPLSMKWFENPNVIPFDAMPQQAGEYCWFRFDSPPAMQSLKLTAIGDITVYANGVQMDRSGDVYTPCKFTKSTSKIAIRIKQDRGVYKASAITAPIEFSCGKGIITIGDWSKTDGLRCYSGGILYSKNFEIDRLDKVILDMGTVVSTAKVTVNGQYAGIKIAPPFRMDITKFVRIGENLIEILVHNTLSNQMITIPTHYNGKLDSGFIS